MSIFKDKYILEHNIEKEIKNNICLFVLKPIKIQKILKNGKQTTINYIQSYYEENIATTIKYETFYLHFGDVVKIKLIEDKYCTIEVLNGHYSVKNEIFNVNKNELMRYTIRIPKENRYYNSDSYYDIEKDIHFTITKQRIFTDVILNFDLNLFDSSYERKDVLFDIVYPIIDLFENYDEIIINTFINGIVDTLNDLQEVFVNCTKCYTKTEMLRNVVSFIREVRDSIKDLPYHKETFKSVEEMLSEEVEERVSYQKEEKRKEDEKNAQYEDFVKRVKVRRELLEHFNTPLNEIPKKISKL